MKIRLFVLFFITFIFKSILAEPVSYWVIGDNFKIDNNARLWNSEYSRQHRDYKVKNRIWNADSNTVKLIGVHHEYISFQLVVENISSLTDMTFELKPQHSTSQKAVLDKNQFSFFKELWIEVKEPSKFNDGKQVISSLGRGWYPDPLLPINVKSPTGKLFPHTVIWVDLFIPDSLTAGNYQAEISFAADSTKIGLIEVELQVLDFTLPIQSTIPVYWQFFPTSFWRGHQLQETWFGQSQNWQLAYQYYQIAADHRASLVFRGVRPKATFDPKTGQLLSVNWSDYYNYLAPVFSGKIFDDPEKAPQIIEAPIREDFPNPKQFEGGKFSPAHQRAVKEYAEEMWQFFSKNGWQDRLVTYYNDEPNSPEKYREHQFYSRLISEATNGKLRYMITEQPFNPDPYSWQSSKYNRQFPSLVFEDIDIWAAVANLYFPDDMQRIAKRGAEKWVYQWDEPYIGGQFIDADGLSMRSWGWLAWKYNIDGLLYWAVNFWNREPFINPVTQGNLNGDGTLFHPGQSNGQNIPISSFRMKAFRRGLQDFELLYKLEQFDPDNPLLQQGRQLLGDALGKGSQYHGYSLRKGKGQWSRNPDEWDNLIKNIKYELLRESN